MSYHIEAEHVSLDDLRIRIEETDLVPSRKPLLDGIKSKFKIFKQHDITSLALLRKKLKNKKHLESLSVTTGIEEQYLILLRREVNSYFPKPIALKHFDWLSQKEINKLVDSGIRTTGAFYDISDSAKKRIDLANRSGIDINFLEKVFQLSNLTRVQWVSPTASKMLVEAGFKSVSRLAESNEDDLHEALIDVNQGDRFFKGKIGLRDIRRLIMSANYVQSWSEKK
jgi:hypothetical protein